MKKTMLPIVAASLIAYALPFAGSAHAQTWSAVDCQIVIDFVQRHKAREEAFRRDRLTLERSFRGTSYESFSRIEDQLSEDGHEYWFFQDDDLFLTLMKERCGWP